MLIAPMIATLAGHVPFVLMRILPLLEVNTFEHEPRTKGELKQLSR